MTAFPRSKRSRLIAVGAAAGIMVAVGAATADAATASPADGTTGYYELCSDGTYPSYVDMPPVGDQAGFDSVIAEPGQCVPIYLNGDEAYIYGIYPGGSSFYIGSEWWPANIATNGDEGPGDYSFSVF
jgi:hypothetical protein